MKILRIALVALGIAVIALPAGAAAKQGQNGKLKGNAARLCKQLRKDMEPEAFKAAYGNNKNHKNAKGKCVQQTKRTLRSLRNAARTSCQTPAVDDSPQGTQAVLSSRGGEHPENGQNSGKATGKARHACVVAATADDVAAVKQAQTECRAELAADPVAFDANYGSDENDADDVGRDDNRNDDFADCVDKHAKAADAANDAA